jgi:membrane protease YdiL (CAAX protease family)
VVALLIVNISTLLLFRLPEIKYFKGIYFNETYQYLLMTLIGGCCVWVMKPPTIGYFGWPRFKWVGFVLVAIAAVIVAMEISNGYNIKQPLRVKIAGVIFLLAIGLGEEMICRVLIFGTLQRFGTRFAVLASSFIFGLMHINLYLPNWDSWAAYWHVMSATGFGVFACALIIATRSYWLLVIFHGLSDWSVVFDKLNTYTGKDYSPGILEGLWWGIEDFGLLFGFLGLVALYFMRGRWPKWLMRIGKGLALKLKLVEREG